MGRRPGDAALLAYLEALKLEQSDRALWSAIAHLDRARLPGGDSLRDVVIIADKRQ